MRGVTEYLWIRVTRFTLWMMKMTKETNKITGWLYSPLIHVRRYYIEHMMKICTCAEDYRGPDKDGRCNTYHTRRYVNSSFNLSVYNDYYLVICGDCFSVQFSYTEP